ncbi:MAG: hypothetical protein IPO62_16600 [Saprospiraceae bacterium]|nr:hypothetical protein [Saprospiraceae bacterium]
MLPVLLDASQLKWSNAQITAPLNETAYTGEFAAPFVNRFFGFGSANWIGVIGTISVRLPIKCL